MKLTAPILAKIAGASVNDNMRSIVKGLDVYGVAAGLDKPHRLAHYIAQVAQESGGFKYDQELWGPTAAQKRYDTRADLGNTPAKDGDGERYKGRTAIQITGKANYVAFRGWCRAQGLDCPDFVANPEALNTDPWEGLGPVWFWATHDLNRLADENNIEQITKTINGGNNGFAERVHWYVRAALVLAGFAPADVKGFQAMAQQAGLLPPDEPGRVQVDGDPGPLTRTALHKTLAAMSKSGSQIKAAPVVETVVKEVAVAPAGGEKSMFRRIFGSLSVGGPVTALMGGLAGLDKVVILTLIGIGIVGSLLIVWQGEWIAGRFKAVFHAFNEEEGKP